MAARRAVCAAAVVAATAASALPPPSFSCAVNALAFSTALKLQPFRGPSFATSLREALNASACGGFTDVAASPLRRAPPRAPAPAPALRVVVDPTGTAPGAVRSVALALAEVRRRREAGGGGAATIELLAGAHRVGPRGLRLTAADSHVAFVGPRGGDGAWLTGAEALPASVAWQPVDVTGGRNVWAADLGPWLAALGVAPSDGVVGLRVAGARQTRARYPNADPERDGFGSALRADAWLPPAPYSAATQFSPPTPARNVTGNYTRFALGVGGACAVFSPPASFWCSTGRTQSGGDALFELPTGLVASRAVLPHAPYANPATALVHAFRPSRWESYVFSVNGTGSNASVLTFGGGGWQGARGCAAGEAFFVEGVLEELDAPAEWFFDSRTSRLLLWHNATSGTPPPQSDAGVPGTGVEVPLARVIVNLTGSVGVSFSSVGFRDARSTIMDPHAVPSGGDWALARSAALYLEGTAGTSVDECVFSRLDGTALLAFGFTRGLAITRCEFAWLGESAVALWGATTGAGAVGVPEDGPDGTAGAQPWGSRVDANVFRELGVYEKQAAAVFVVKSGATSLTRNVAFNAPRAAFVFNDGFGGGNAVFGNVLFNLVRETGPPSDHGPTNFWDRVAYEWLDNNGQPTSTKETDVVARNLMIGNYWTSTPVDTDDGTRYVNVTDNVLVSGTIGAKQPFAGARLVFARNLHAYVGVVGYHLYHPPDAGWAFTNVTLVQAADGDYGVNTVCAGEYATTLGGNIVLTPTGNVTECGEPLAQWVRAGNDVGSTAGTWPSDDALIEAARALLAPIF